MRRKDFIKTAGLGTGAILAGSSLTAFLAGCGKSNSNMGGMGGTPVNVIDGNFSQILPIPNVVGENATLIAQTTTANVSGTGISVLGYQANGILGPTIRTNKGSNAAINLQNKLAEPTNIHWHGLKIPSNMDGYPTDVVNVNSSFSYQFLVNQRAGLYWYHPHPDGLTAKQVFQGLAGLFIVNDPEELTLNLPGGAYEIPLVIQDKRLSATGITYSPSMMDIMTGYMGDSIIVNGVHAPYTEVSTRYYRLRILNGSNARIYNLTLSNNADMIIIGNDAGLLKNPATVRSVLLAPGERLDVLVNFAGLSIGDELFLENRTFSGAGTAQGKQAFKIMKFKITQVVSDIFTVPSTLSNIISLNASGAVKTRNFNISNAGMSMGMGGGMRHRINDKVFDATRIDEIVNANTVEIWVFDNSQGDEPHPMHIHAVQFQVLQRTGGRNQVIASEAGWKDTVLVMPGEIVKVIIPFEDYPGKFVFHCHNLEHEDDGMMLQYQLS
ncbi:MAG: multicopper oxidase domain-containing protein [Sphingobacteriales bacterium]|nr:multicopper oxidase domain-containing protein [Sphingobacteriales bacterium]